MCSSFWCVYTCNLPKWYTCITGVAHLDMYWERLDYIVTITLVLYYIALHLYSYI